MKVYSEFVRHLAHLFARANIFPCALFGRSFETRKEFLDWKRKEWTPIADESCKLNVENPRSMRDASLQGSARPVPATSFSVSFRFCSAK